MKLRNTSKMAIQAAVAIALAELLSLTVHIERGYWITLSAMALTTQTWGESVKRSFERVGMTVLGGMAGTLLYFFLPANQALILTLLLVFIFLTVYMLPVYYLAAIFFLTCFVVFLFALVGNWDWYLLRARIIDTATGAGIAITVGCFLFPVKTNVVGLFTDYLYKIKASFATVFNTKRQISSISSQILTVDFHGIKKKALAIRYELMFNRFKPRDFNQLLNHIGFCKRYTVNLIESYEWLQSRLSEKEIAAIHAAVATTEYNIDALIRCLQQEKNIVMKPAADVANLLQKEIIRCPEHFATLESDALGFYSLMYFFTQLNASLNRIFAILSQ